MSCKIYFVVEEYAKSKLLSLISRHLEMGSFKVGVDMPESPHEYQLIVLWNLRYIVKELPKTRNVIVFHSSDLPKGRGWAPIYYAIAENRREHVITAFIPDQGVDTGKIVAKARFGILISHTAKILREIDEVVTMYMIREISKKFRSQEIIGARQVGAATNYQRRSPEDNEVDPNQTLISLINHIKACEDSHPAFFIQNGCKFSITIEPDEPPGLPNDLKIEFEVDFQKRL